MIIDPEKDGIDHVNVYSKGKTWLGRKLSNFADTPFTHPDHGRFRSVEGYWYWWSCRDDSLRGLHGFEAKKKGRELRGDDWNSSDEFKIDILTALSSKLTAHSSILSTLQEEGLPLKHYYVYGGKVVEPKEGKWIIEFFESMQGKL